MLVLAFLAVLGEAATDLLEPWPLKIVFDYVFGTKPMPSWMSGLIGATFGLSKVSILHFAILAVIVIAAGGALSSYAEKYLTTSVGQWVMHDLRRILYHHIQRLSLAYHDHKPTGDLISTVTADIDSIQDFISQALLGMVVAVLTLVGMLAVMFYLNWRFTLIALSITPFLFAVVYTYTRRIKQASRQTGIWRRPKFLAKTRRAPGSSPATVQICRPTSVELHIRLQKSRASRRGRIRNRGAPPRDRRSSL